jgi:glutamine synthetase
MNPKISLKGLSHVEMQFVDLSGRLRAIDVTQKRYIESLTEGKVFDGSSVHMAPIENSDLVLKPVPSTFFRLPWNPKAGRVLCDIQTTNDSMKEFEISPRFVLKKQLNEARKRGLKFFTAVENEFFVLNGGKLIDEAGYFSPTPIDKTKSLRQKLFEVLTEYANIEVEYMHHEVSSGQGEITLKVEDALRMADNTIAFRYLAQNLAFVNGMLLTLMPKLKAGINGSGMHIHMSLFDLKGKNLFYSKDDEFKISEIARNFIAGILEHYRALTGLAAPTINSRKRLVPGYEAPVNKAWGPKNRSALIRIPAFKSEKAARIEFRMPDSTSNPYLLFAAILATGLEGVEKGLNPGEACLENTYEGSKWKTIPERQEEVIKELEKDKLIGKVLGEAFSRYVEILKREWKEFSAVNKKWDPLVITDWERKRYLQL